VVFNGADSPVTQTFGLGLFGELTVGILDEIERFFFERGAPVVHEVSPLAGVAALDLLCERGYRPVEISSVMYRPVTAPVTVIRPGIRARVASEEDLANWAGVMSRGWLNEYPEQAEFIRENGAISADWRGNVPFLAELEGQPGAAGALYVHEGVALFGGATTAPEVRRQGLQAALIEARMRYAFDRGCELLMMVAEAGSQSQRNAERNGFRIAYTRVKWRKDKP